MRVDPTYISNLVGSLDQTQSSEQQLSSELSSGASITSLSQNPVGAGENVLFLNQIQQDDSFTESSNLVTGQLQVGDSALGSVVSELTQAISLATSANNGTMNSSDVKSIANQISGILDEVQSLGNTSYQGQYILREGIPPWRRFRLRRHISGRDELQRRREREFSRIAQWAEDSVECAGRPNFHGRGTNSVFGALNALVADYSSGR